MIEEKGKRVLLMCCKLIHLQVENIYEKWNISFTPFFLDTVKLFKEKRYKKVLDLGCGYGKHSISCRK